MKIARIEKNGKTLYAEYRNGKYYQIKGDPFGLFTVSANAVKTDKLLAPAVPSKIIAVGANYKKHAAELDLPLNLEPVIFLKPPTAVLEPFGKILYPEGAAKVDYEAELAIVITKHCRHVKKGDALSYVLGYTCANDVSERVFQKLDGQWARAKGFDTFCPLGPYIETDVDPSALTLETYVNGECRQSGNTADMIHNVPAIIEFVSGVMTLLPGDVILTGTPDGIGEVRRGDSVEVRIERIGSLFNTVV